MTLPNWVTFLVAAFVIVFGCFRLYLAKQLADARKAGDTSERPNYRRRGYYSRSPRTHVLFGIAYLALGALCLALGFGWIELRLGEQPADPASASSLGDGVEVERVAPPDAED